MMKRTVLFLMIVFIVGCKESKPNADWLLDKAEEDLEQSPDSALVLLNSLSQESISSEKIKARYALLKSIALDKNYIDVADDSLTPIAVEYYSKKGSADEKLKAYMYNGRVLEYAGDYEKAMENYIVAEESVSGCKDIIYTGLLYNSKGMVYMRIYENEKAVQQFKRSSEIYLKANDTTRYLNSVNNIVSALSASNDQNYDNSYLSILEQNWDKLTLRQKSNYYARRLILSSELDNLSNDIDLYIKDIIQESLINWLIVAQSYIKIGDYIKAEEALQLHQKYSNNINSTFYIVSSQIEYQKGNYKLAYDYLDEYNKYLAKVSIQNTKGDTRFLEERFKERERVLTQRYYIALLFVGVLILLFLVFLLTRLIKDIRSKHRREELRMQMEIDEYQNKYNQVLIEHERLQGLVNKSKSNVNFSEAIRSLLESRLSVLNTYIVSNISGTYSEKASKELNKLMEDKDEFVKSMGISFMVTQPKFIKFLQKHDLNEWEIGCCCLYCLGLNGSEISSYLEQKAYYYKRIGVLRNKLGLDRSTNIDTYLRKLISKYK